MIVALLEKRDKLNLFYTLEAQAQSSQANHTFLIYKSRNWTYAQAYETVLKYGAWLKSKGVQKDEIVAMDFWNSDVFIWIWFGLWSIGAKPAFINNNLTGKPLLHTIRTSTARLVLVDQDGKHKFSEEVMAEHGFIARATEEGFPEDKQVSFGFESDPSHILSMIESTANVTAPTLQKSKDPPPTRQKLEIIFFDEGLESHILSLAPVRLPDSERSNQKRNGMGMLIYTSGTTGLPKPAVLGWGKANMAVRWITGWLPLKQNDVIYTSMPLYHSSASVLAVCATLHAGATICLGKKFSHKTFWPEVCASKATVIQYVGETCRYLLSAPKSPLDQAHRVRLAFGNGLRPDVWQPFKDRFNIPTICELYASTEGPGGLFNHSTNSFSAGAIGRRGTITRLLARYRDIVVRMDPESEPPEPLRDIDTNFCQLANYDEPGELLYQLDSKNISAKFQGYFRNDKATNSKILRDVLTKGDAYFRSGDLIKRDKEGRSWFVDRLGDTFRWKAENVSTTEVSSAISTHDSIEEANVYGVFIPRHDGRAGCAALIFKKGDSKAEDDGQLTLPNAQTLKSLADHVKKGLPGFAVPLFIRITRSMDRTGTNKQQKHRFQVEGIDIEEVERSGDALFWLKDGTYERFTKRDLDRINGGQVRL